MKSMKATTDPFEMADLAWEDTHEKNFDRMAEHILAAIERIDPPVTNSSEFISRVMELSWKTGFACGLEFTALGLIKSFPSLSGKN
jgi:hypothetical protein